MVRASQRQGNQGASDDRRTPAAVAKFEADVEALCDLIDVDVPDGVYDRCADFLDDVRSQVSDVGETVARTGRVTERQRDALDNWTAAVEKMIDEAD